MMPAVFRASQFEWADLAVRILEAIADVFSSKI
jgi:hypothetical protein